MNWDAIGAIAELLGAIGVIASLVYLARTIRQSREHIQHLEPDPDIPLPVGQGEVRANSLIEVLARIREDRSQAVAGEGRTSHGAGNRASIHPRRRGRPRRVRRSAGGSGACGFRETSSVPGGPRSRRGRHGRTQVGAGPLPDLEPDGKQDEKPQEQAC